MKLYCFCQVGSCLIDLQNNLLFVLRTGPARDMFPCLSNTTLSAPSANAVCRPPAVAHPDACPSSGRAAVAAVVAAAGSRHPATVRRFRADHRAPGCCCAHGHCRARAARARPRPPAPTRPRPLWPPPHHAERRARRRKRRQPWSKSRRSRPSLTCRLSSP